jgi:hypothetical protein
MAQKRRIKKETVSRIREALEALAEVFYVRGVDLDEDSEDNDDYIEEISYTQPEDVEVAIGEFLSLLIENKVFTKQQNVDSFSTVFELIFGEDHELKAKAEYFEELVNGYEGFVSLEDMREAENVIRGMMDELPVSKDT